MVRVFSRLDVNLAKILFDVLEGWELLYHKSFANQLDKYFYILRNCKVEKIATILTLWHSKLHSGYMNRTTHFKDIAEIEKFQDNINIDDYLEMYRALNEDGVIKSNFDNVIIKEEGNKRYICDIYQ